MKSPRSNSTIVQFYAGQGFAAYYYDRMEENFFILEGEVDIVVDDVAHHLSESQKKNIGTLAFSLAVM